MQSFLSGFPESGLTKLKKPIAKDGQNARDNLPWVEKHRPKTVDEIIFQDEVVAVLKKCLGGSDLPNFLFYGPPGTGKTSAAIALARELFGAEIYKDRVLELNASDERGIQVVRDKVKKFAQLAAASTRPDGRPCPSLRLIILDECDSMTNAAQSALRRTMETESKTTRFILICNYISRIIPPLTSRCAKFRFKPLSVDIVKKKLNSICSSEHIQCSVDALDLLISSCEGDLRKSTTLLQSASKFKIDEPITALDMMEAAGVVPTEVIEHFCSACQAGSFEQLEAAVKTLMSGGYAAYQVVSQVFEVVLSAILLSDPQKAVICDKIAVCDKRLLDGADEYLQLMDLGCCMIHQWKRTAS